MTNLQTLIEKLRQKRLSDQDIVATVETVSKTALLEATSKMTTFIVNTPQAKELENISDENQRNLKLAQIYEQATGKSSEKFIQEIIESVAGKFLEEIKE